MSLSSKDKALKIAQILEDKKGIDVRIMDIQELTVMTDYFVIASGNTEIQVQALYEAVEEAMKEEGIEAKRRDGHRGGRWIVVDYGDVFLHVFRNEERALYDLERLWAEGKSLFVDNP